MQRREVLRKATVIMLDLPCERWQPEHYVIMAFYTSNLAYLPSIKGTPPRTTVGDHLQACAGQGERFTCLGEEMTYETVALLFVEMRLREGERLVHVGSGFGRVLWAAFFLYEGKLAELHAVETHEWRYQKSDEFRKTFAGRCWLVPALRDAVTVHLSAPLACASSRDATALPLADVIIASDERASLLQLLRFDWMLAQSPFRLLVSYQPPGTYKNVDERRAVPRFLASHDDGVDRAIYFYRPRPRLVGS
jgi:hypothetical protein